MEQQIQKCVMGGITTVLCAAVEMTCCIVCGLAVAALSQSCLQ